jgi:hypothetical protein
LSPTFSSGIVSCVFERPRRSKEIKNIGVARHGRISPYCARNREG